MATIFLSYRRVDSAGYAGRLHRGLAEELGEHQVFIDFHGIELGGDWRKRITTELVNANFVLVLIAHHWFALGTDGVRRIDRLDDLVRYEIFTALSLGKKVIPVLFDNVPMPPPEQLPDDIRELSARQAISVTTERWEFDLGRLLGALLGADQFAPTISRLAAALSAPTPQERHSAISTLASLNNPMARDVLARNVNHPIPGVGTACAIALGALGDERAVPALVTCLGKAETQLRKQIVSSLVTIGAAATDALLEALQSPDGDVASTARDVLRRIRSDNLVVPLRRLLSSTESQDVVRKAADLLGWVNGTPALEDLRQLAFSESADTFIREEAIRSLGMLRDGASIPQLTQLLSAVSSNISHAAVAALHLINTPESTQAVYRKEQNEIAAFRDRGDERGVDIVEGWFRHYGLFAEYDDRLKIARSRSLV